ncbi:MAG: hypothetical protein HY074_11970 [Deltaproteobacteria bacterium]|nr:hypothetical protein [Deltaproteobacteria bacterium]
METLGLNVRRRIYLVAVVAHLWVIAGGIATAHYNRYLGLPWGAGIILAVWYLKRQRCLVCEKPVLLKQVLGFELRTPWIPHNCSMCGTSYLRQF